ncbi:MAG: acyltransferase family protein [Polyangiaceae bacterium]
MRYRRDVDGLRAVAVVPVVLFHLGIPGFGGGFVGVDVFFVISGFLITSLLVGAQERFSLARFYDRRIRRIFPALFTVMAAAAIGVLVLSFPGDVKAMGKQILAATLFCANLLFYRESGYFDAAAHDKPLLHTWSLSVEEQFYLFFPPLLWVLTRVVPRARTAIVAALFAASFGAAIWLVKDHPAAAFYLPHARAWELFAGSLLALHPLPNLGRTAGTIASILGLAGILASVFLFGEQTPFPGLLAAPSVFGTALLLSAGANDEGGPIQRVLATAPLVAIGKLSYSLYLWHWPVIVLLRGWLLRELGPVEWAAVIAASLVLSIASYRLVEQPARARRPAAFRSLAAGLVVIGAFVGLGGWLYKTSGLRASKDADVPRGPEDYLNGVCLLETRQRFDAWKPDHCTFPAPSSNAPKVVLWGDSYAGHYAPGLRLLQADVPFELVQVTKDGCPPLPAATDLTDTCRGFVDGALAYIASERPRLVVVAARWNKFFDRERIRREAGDMLTRVAASGARVLLVGESPVYAATGPQIRARLLSRGLPADTFRPKNAFLMDEPLRAAAAEQGATFFSPREALCDGLACRISVDATPIHWDAGHLSTAGSELLARAMRPLVESLTRGAPADRPE